MYLSLVVIETTQDHDESRRSSTTAVCKYIRQPCETTNHLARAIF